MKYIILFFAISFLVIPASAQDKVKDVLAVYKKKVIPYLDEMAKKEFNTTGNNSSFARLNELESKVDHKVNLDVIESCKKNNISDNAKSITLIAESVYKQYFAGLPKEFYDSAKADSQKL